MLYWKKFIGRKPIIVIGPLVLLVMTITAWCFSKNEPVIEVQYPINNQIKAAENVTGKAKEVQDKNEEKAQDKPKVLTHEIQAGDTLGGIAKKYGIDVDTILACNQGLNEKALKIGQKIKFLSVKGVIHQVQNGQSIWQICRRYQIDMKAVLAANGISEESKLKIGQELILPGAKPIVFEKELNNAKSTRKTSKVYMASRSSRGFSYPVRGRITSRYGKRWGRMHEGIDIAASTGTPIHASAPGRVTYAGWKNGYGKCIIIDHGNGYQTLYGHNSVNLVSAGTEVGGGQLIAKVGSTGRSTGPHVHFEIRIHGNPVNPANYLH